MTLHWPLNTPPTDYIYRYGADAKHSALAFEILAELDEAEFEMDSWGGRPNYHCPFCKFACLSLDETRAHVRRHSQPVVLGASRTLEGLEEE